MTPSKKPFALIAHRAEKSIATRRETPCATKEKISIPYYLDFTDT